MHSTASPGVLYFRQCAGTSRGWHLGSIRAIVSIPICWSAPHGSAASGEVQQGLPSSLQPSTLASSKPPVFPRSNTPVVSITRHSSSTTVFLPARLLSTLELLLHDIGLTIARDKTEVVPACSAVQNFTTGDFAGYTWVADGNVKLLGAATGAQAWCESLLGKRVSKARVLLDAIGLTRLSASSMLRGKSLNRS